MLDVVEPALQVDRQVRVLGGEVDDAGPCPGALYLVTALTGLLTKPPVHGAKLVEHFDNHICDPNFVATSEFIQATYFTPRTPRSGRFRVNRPKAILTRLAGDVHQLNERAFSIAQSVKATETSSTFGLTLTTASSQVPSCGVAIARIESFPYLSWSRNSTTCSTASSILMIWIARPLN
ncbi:hypothetical protein IOD16_18160 [Saccharothrix sp. 6-C]|uniref:hypothetical protein n=1 Tax=Saccharothrix sp. 6-C TaxID=2781735 RepID=UPI0019174AC0|nr:hypothetical protein [Saccharothrix sp. 6-C]QQQ80136.1 hypothetical protein IOD16_18160 [Saccharothrix sp. 6-C]